VIGLARMAWRLAYLRAWGIDATKDGCPFPFQSRWSGQHGSAHRAYYKIIDRITRGKKP